MPGRLHKDLHGWLAYFRDDLGAWEIKTPEEERWGMWDPETKMVYRYRRGRPGDIHNPSGVVDEIPGALFLARAIYRIPR